MKKMKLLKTAIASLALSSTLASAQMLDKVIAIVDSDVVMASELQSQIGLIAKRLKSQQSQMPPLNELRHQVLEHLIRERLQLQMGARAGVQPSDQEINQAIGRMAAANKMSMQDFEQQIAKDGMSMNMLKEKVRREVIVDRVQQGSVNRRINISEQQVDNFLASQEGKFWISPDYKLGHILIGLSSAADAETKSEAKAKAEKLAQALQAGANFAELAIANSSGQNALKGGDLGWRKTAQLPNLLAEAIPTLNKGDISPVLRSDAGFHILKLYDQRGGGETIVEQSKVRHILVKPSTILSGDEAKAKVAELRQQIIQGADFSELAKENSEDIGSMLKGGDLGWSTPGQFLPEFEAAMNALAAGEISQPIRTKYGWHILKVDERRQQDFTDTVIRNQASRLIRKRRFEEELQNWLQEIRDEAYVEIKLKDEDDSTES